MPDFELKLQHDGQVFPLVEGTIFRIGRAPDCDICLESDGVSRLHSAFACKNGICAVKDLDSVNGTYLNGHRIAKATILKNGDLIRISSHTLQFSVNKATAIQSRENAAAPALPSDDGSGRHSTSMRLPRAMLLDPNREMVMREMLDSEPPFDAKRQRRGETTKILHSDAPNVMTPVEKVKTDESGAEKTSMTFDPPAEVPPCVTNGETGKEGPAAVHDEFQLTRELRQAIDDRLAMYDLLSDLAAERDMLRHAEPSMPADIAAELARQDREVLALPSSAITAANLADIRAEKTDSENARHGLAGKVRQLAEQQWDTLDAHNAGHLPAIYSEVAKAMPDEPLLPDLSAAGVDASELMNGAYYYLALERLEKETAELLASVQSAIRDRKEKQKKNTSVTRRLQNIVQTLYTRKPDAAGNDELGESEKNCAARLEILRREKEFMERELIDVFWRTHRRAALCIVSRKIEPTLAALAFIRFGVISLHPRWIEKKAADKVTRECATTLSPGDFPGSATKVLYVDEYLAAIMRMELAPSPVGDMAAQNKNSLPHKSERAFRKMVNSRLYCAQLEEAVRAANSAVARLDGEIRSLSSIPEKDITTEQGFELLALQERRTTLENFAAGMINGVLRKIQKDMAETEARFRTGDLIPPSPIAALEQECGQIVEFSRFMSGAKERFLPLLFRDDFIPEPQSDAMFDRREIAETFSRLERLDPGAFMEVILPSRKNGGQIGVRTGPMAVILPARGIQGYLCQPKEGMDCGRLMLPTSSASPAARDRLFLNLMADYRWESSRKMVGLDAMKSDTIAGAFTRLRWEWRNYPRQKREKGLIFTEQTDSANWRRIYACHILGAMEGGKKLLARNPQCHSNIIAKYFIPPEGVHW